MAAAAAWRAARHKTATSLLAAAPTERFEAFVRKWAESDDEPYAARGQTLRARGDYPDLSERPAWPRPAWADELEAHADIIAAGTSPRQTLWNLHLILAETTATIMLGWI